MLETIKDNWIILSVAFAALLLILFIIYRVFFSYSDEEDEGDEKVHDDIVDGEVVFDGDEIDTFSKFLRDSNIIAIRDNMLIYAQVDGTKKFVGFGKGSMSNPVLQSMEERNLTEAELVASFNNVQDSIQIVSIPLKVDHTEYYENLEQGIRARFETPDYRQTDEQMHEQKLRAKAARELLNEFKKYETDNETYEASYYYLISKTLSDEDMMEDTEEERTLAMFNKAEEELKLDFNTLKAHLKAIHRDVVFLDSISILEVLYRTFNPEKSLKVTFRELVKSENYSSITTGLNDEEINKRIEEFISDYNVAYSEALQKRNNRKQLESQRKELEDHV